MAAESDRPLRTSSTKRRIRHEVVTKASLFIFSNHDLYPINAIKKRRFPSASYDSNAVGELQNAVGELQNAVGELQNAVVELQNAVVELQNAVVELQAEHRIADRASNCRQSIELQAEHRIAGRASNCKQSIELQTEHRIARSDCVEGQIWNAERPGFYRIYKITKRS